MSTKKPSAKKKKRWLVVTLRRDFDVAYEHWLTAYRGPNLADAERIVARERAKQHSAYLIDDTHGEAL